MDDKTKEGHLRLALIRILAPFDSYGQGIFIPPAITAIMKEFKKWK